MTNTPTLAQVANARHSSASNEHYTPPQIVEAARATMGGIDLDPASCVLANEVVQARWIMTNAGVGALGASWTARAPYSSAPDFDMKAEHPARVFLNPPGGLLLRATLEPLPFNPETGQFTRKGVRIQECVSTQAVWWSKLVHEWTIGNVEQAIFVCFNLEVLRLTQEPIEPFTAHTPAAAFPICFLKDRPQYWNEATPVEKRGVSGAPTHAGAVVFLPRKSELSPSQYDTTPQPGVTRFRAAFSTFGHVRV